MLFCGTLNSALALGFTYTPASQLAEQATLEQILRRLDTLGSVTAKPTREKLQDADALLGLVTPNDVTITQALNLYLGEIALDEQGGKSPEQLKTYTKVKRRAVANFIKLNGDLSMTDIDRDHARKVYRHWADRIHPNDRQKPVSGNSGNRDLGNLRKLYRRYFEHIGQESRENPFRNLRFAAPKLKTIKPFTDDFVRTRILQPSVLEGLNREAALLCYVLIETWCRPNEIANLLSENIRLDDDVPYIRIRSTKARQLKSAASVREIPLVGIAFEAMKRSSDGFPHYRDRGYLLSQSLLKAFKSRELIPSDQHRIYSFRHSFEKRMLEAGLDYGLRCTLMGHRNPRPEYGDGGSLVYRRDELLKIVHPIPDGLLTSYPFPE